LQRLGVNVDEDDLDFVLGVIRRYNPSKNIPIKAWYLWCKANTRGVNFVTSDAPLPSLIERASTDDEAKTVDAAEDAATIRNVVGQAGYAVLQLRYGEGLSDRQTAKRLGMSRESVAWIEKEALARASSLRAAD
jgi:DNA-directed RNA polymerase specialized sigma24 family protein